MLDLFAKALKPSGLLRVATDAEEYAQHAKNAIHLWNQKQRAIDDNGVNNELYFDTLNYLWILILLLQYVSIYYIYNNSTCFIRLESVSRPQWQLVSESLHPAALDGPAYRPVTHYERKAAEAGRPVADLEFRLTY